MLETPFFLHYKEKTGKILIFGIFLANKFSILDYIPLKVNIFRSTMFYCVIVTSYVHRFWWFWYYCYYGSKQLYFWRVNFKFTVHKARWRVEYRCAHDHKNSSTEVWAHGILKGCGMGPWLVLVSPCFRESVVATCKIWSFLCSLDILLQKNVIVLFLEIKFQNGAHFKKGLFLTYVSHFLVTREKLQKFLQHISQTHTCTHFAHHIDFFLPYQFWKKYEFIMYGFSLVWVLMLILIRAILEQSINDKVVSKI